MKLLLTISFLLFCSFCFAQTGELKVNVLDFKTMKTIPFSKIFVYTDKSLLGSFTADSSGNIAVDNLSPGKLNIVSDNKSYKSQTINNISIAADKITFVDLILKKQ